MGIDSRKAPPLPAPTETETTITSLTELATDVSKAPEDDRSHYSLPDDGTPVTIRTRGHKPNRSQTSLLIEYFEGGKGAPSEGSSSSRKPSVRVRLTPSKTRGKNDHIQITETRSSRKSSVSRRGGDDGPLVPSRSELDMTDPEDSRSMNSYASATEESNVSRHPIEVEITPGQRRRRERKVSSPLIPAADSNVSGYVPPNMSDISAIPTDSFLDGSGGNTAYSLIHEERRSKSPSRGEALAAGALGAVAAAAVADKMNRKSRNESQDRKIIERALEKASKPERKHKSKSRTSSLSEREIESSSRRRSKGGHKESVVSAADSSVLSSQMTPSHRSYDSHSSSKVSINNPKLLETVEDAIRRLILPELESLKRERSQRETRRSKDRESLSSLTSVSREELSTTNKRRSVDTTHSTKSRGREARNDLSPQSSVEHVSVPEDHEYSTPHRGGDHHHLTDAALLGAAAAAGAALGSRDRSRSDEKRQRRRRRAKTPERGRAVEEYDEVEHEVIPPMPLSSEINPSELTRTSILSADTDRPHSASEEMAPVREVVRGSMEDILETPTPSRTPVHHSLQSLGAQHANVSHGDLKDLPRKGPGDYEHYDEDSELSQLSQRDPSYEGYDEYDEEGRLAEPGMYESNHGYYNQQDVPPPLRYVPYQQERRGLSPIQSVSGYTEGESDIHQRRDSRATQSEWSSPGKSPSRDPLRTPSSIPSNMRSREFGDEENSIRSSGNYRDTRYTDDSELDRVTSGQAVQPLGGKPLLVHHLGAESAVASLVDGSTMDASILSGGQDYRDSQLSYDSRFDEHLSRGGSPTKRSVESHHEIIEDRNQSPALSKQTGSNVSREVDEYELNEYGQKVPSSSRYRQSPTASEQAITNAALSRAAAAALKAAKTQSPYGSTEDVGEQWDSAGVVRNKSFKERAKADGYRPETTPRHSTDRLSDDYEQPKMGASGLPDADYPMPEIGYYEDDGLKTPSVVQGPLGGPEDHENWAEVPTPTQERTFDYDRAVTPKASERGDAHGLGIAETAAAATLAAAAGMVASHSRQPSQEQDNEWQRTSSERKRDTLITNPYEGTSPIANLPGVDSNMLGAAGFGSAAYRGGFNSGSPGLPQGDEGYETAQPNELRDPQAKDKGVAFQLQPGMATGSEDPFYTPAPKHNRQLSGMSQGMGSPLYDGAMGTGIDRIQSKDIIALMEHLMVRDAQRSARDTEILVTLVRSAAEMRNSFNDIKRLLAETEDQIIGEVKDNTDKTVQRHLGGPRPFPGSAARSLQGGSQSGTFDDLPAKKRNLFRRALKGLSNKGANDLGRIEDMLMQLLSEVDVLKHQTAGAPGMAGMSTQNRSLENIAAEGQYEQDHGYEPEGTAGTSITSHATQSGHLSQPQSRGTSTKGGYERKFSDHRISTVPEGDEEAYYDEQDLMSPAVPRGGSVPLGTPPQIATQEQSASYENTPVTDGSKKHKSRGSASFFPKISRWSETTTSSIGKVFRGSRKQDPEEFLQHPTSQSGSDFAEYENYPVDSPYGTDKLHSGFSDQNLAADAGQLDTPVRHQLHDPPQGSLYTTPEDPKYKAHRNSINLQHPQPRPGQTERFRTALESSAQDYDSTMTPRSADWAGSATSLPRFAPPNTQRYSGQSASEEYAWAQQARQAGPPRPPKEPLDEVGTPLKHDRLSKLQGKQSPLPFHSVDSGYGGTATHIGTTVGTASYHSASPRPENRNLSGALEVPTRRPSGPRAMTPSRGMSRSRGSEDGESIRSGRSAGDQQARDERRRKRDTFGSVASPASHVSQESETF
ncbi:hypothetical protein BX600DRAFT_510179 [Xylariales sp. PMI_506]|nr:hypothetical protein BX600DRAFT_510179 [Xylariales sp. PMI_506]